MSGRKERKTQIRETMACICYLAHLAIGGDSGEVSLSAFLNVVNGGVGGHADAHGPGDVHLETDHR